MPTTSSDLYALGLTSRKLTDEIRRGRVVRLRQGVHIAAEAVPDDGRERHLLQAAAEQAADPRLVASHETAALAWGLPLIDEDAAVSSAPVLTAPRGTGRRSGTTATARIHVAELPSHHITRHPEGLRLTSPARTAIDVAAGELPHVLVVLDATLRLECQQISSGRRRDLANPRIQDAGRTLLLEAATTARPRDPALRAAIALADARRETPIESLSAGHMRLAGIPDPIPQAHIRTVLGSLYSDFLWPEHRLIGEADGALKYQTQDAMLQEKQREQVLRDMGFSIVRWTGKEIHLTPARVIDRIERALAAAG